MIRRIAYITACCCVLGQPVFGGSLGVAGEVTLPLPDNWLLTTDTVTFPVQLMYAEGGAEILLFRSVVSDDELIMSEGDLRLSVKEVETGVIGSLPDGTLLTSTGFHEGDRAGFFLEFLSTDTVSGLPLMHRLEGVVYRHPDGYQLLFTVWAKAGVDTYPALEADIKAVQQGFRYIGAMEADVFREARRPSYWMLLLLALAVIGIFIFYRPRKGRRQAARAAPTDHFWRCECGRANHDTAAICQRCGRERSRARTP